MKRFFAYLMLVVSVASMGCAMNESSPVKRNQWLSSILLWLGFNAAKNDIREETFIQQDRESDLNKRESERAPGKTTVIVVGRKNSDEDNEGAEYESLAIPEWVHTGAHEKKSSSISIPQRESKSARSYRESFRVLRRPTSTYGSRPGSDDQSSPRLRVGSRYDRPDIDSFNSQEHFQRLQQLEKEALQGDKVAHIAQAVSKSQSHALQQEKNEIQLKTNPNLGDRPELVQEESEGVSPTKNRNTGRKKSNFKLGDIIPSRFE